jgi:MipA family protein
MKINIESDFQPLGNPKSESASAQVGISLLGAIDLSGDARDGGWGVFGLVNYSRLTGDAKRSPVTSLRGDADQWFLAGGISYTF